MPAAVALPTGRTPALPPVACPDRRRTLEPLPCPVAKKKKKGLAWPAYRACSPPAQARGSVSAVSAPARPPTGLVVAGDGGNRGPREPGRTTQGVPGRSRRRLPPPPPSSTGPARIISTASCGARVAQPRRASASTRDPAAPGPPAAGGQLCCADPQAASGASCRLVFRAPGPRRAAPVRSASGMPLVTAPCRISLVPEGPAQHR